MQLFDFENRIFPFLLGREERQHGTPPFFAQKVILSHPDFLKSRMVFHPSVEHRVYTPSFNIY